MGEYVFYNFNTALYLEGRRASDYIPKHGMCLASYEDYDLILRLIVYTPSKLRSESFFAWSTYRLDKNTGQYHLDDTTEALFDNTKSCRAQRLPKKDELGRIIFQRLKAI